MLWTRAHTGVAAGVVIAGLAASTGLFLGGGASAPRNTPTPSPSATPSPSHSPRAAVGHATGSPIPLGACVSHDALPDPICNPGGSDPRVTQANLKATICRAGYATSVRPPYSRTLRFKRMQMRAYGYTNPSKLYELDHLIPLELGGASNEKNLWPQLLAGSTGARTKDKLENALNRQVCSGKVTLADAQNAIATDWVTAYGKYVGPLPK